MSSFDQRIRSHFPKSDQPIDALADLVFGNELFMQANVAYGGKQHPKCVIDHCGKIPADVIHGQEQLGLVFDVSSRGLRSQKEHLASVSYPFEHLGDPTPALLEVLVHECFRNGLCRTPLEFSAPTPARPTSLEIVNSSEWREGLSIVDMPGISSVPEVDRVHGRAASIKILKYSEKIRSLVSDGKLLIAEAFYDNSTHEVRYISFIMSAAPGKSVAAELLNAVCTGQKIEANLLAQPGLAELSALVIGNRSFCDRAHTAVPTEFIVFGCADSRASPHILFSAPFGLIEVLRNAGNAVNLAVVNGIRHSVEEALVHKEVVNLIVLSHTQCGAVTATLASHDLKNAPAEVATALPIMRSLDARFKEYRGLHPDYNSSDKFLEDAAEVNAISAAVEILNFTGPAGDSIRDYVANGQLRLFPARYTISSGKVDFFPAISYQQVQLGLAQGE